MLEREINIVIEILGRMSTKSKTFKKILEIHNSQNSRLDTFNRVKKSRKSSTNLKVGFNFGFIYTVKYAHQKSLNIAFKTGFSEHKFVSTDNSLWLLYSPKKQF